MQAAGYPAQPPFQSTKPSQLHPLALPHSHSAFCPHCLQPVYLSCLSASPCPWKFQSTQPSQLSHQPAQNPSALCPHLSPPQPLPTCSLELFECISLALEEKEAEHKVCHKDHHQADHHRTGGALTNTLGTAGGGETPRTTDLQYRKQTTRTTRTSDIMRGSAQRLHDDVGRPHDLASEHELPGTWT